MDGIFELKCTFGNKDSYFLTFTPLLDVFNEMFTYLSKLTQITQQI
jgi:hypothetical protein